MNNLNAFEGFAYFSLHADDFNPVRRKTEIGRKPLGDKKLKEQFERVLRERPYTFETWEDLTHVAFDTDEDLYVHLRAIYEYIFNDGPAEFGA